MKRMLLLLLSAVFLLTAAVPSVLAQEAKGKGPSRAADPAQEIRKTITEGEEVELEEQKEESVLTFKPTHNGFYRFYSYDLELGDPYGEIYEVAGDGWVIGNNDDTTFGEGDYNFDVRVYLNKGKTYELHAYDRGEGYAQFKVKVEAMNQITVYLDTKTGSFGDEKTSLTYTTFAGSRVKDIPIPYPEDEYGDYFLGYSMYESADPSDLISKNTVLSNADRLYAVWGYTIPVTFHSNGGVFVYEDEDLWETETEDYTFNVCWDNELISASIPIPTKEGYTFLGWKEPDTVDIVNPENYTYTEAYEFDAVWEELGEVDGVIKPGKAVEVDFGTNQFAFTPDKTAIYLVYSFDHSEGTDPYITVYNDKFKHVDTTDEGGLEHNFWFASEFKAGKTYYLVAKNYEHMPGTYKMVVKKAKKVKLNANGGYYGAYDVDDADDEDEPVRPLEVEEWIADGEDLAYICPPYHEDNRQAVAGWSTVEGASVPNVTPDTKVKEGDTFYAVWRKWNSKKRIEPAKVSGIKTKTYTGKPIKQTIEVSLAGTVLKSGKDYSVKYKNNTKAGIATVTITGKGAYEGTIKKTFIIKPAKTKLTSVKNTAAKTVTVKWKKAASGTGYQLQYGTKKSLSGGKKVTIKKLKTTSKTIRKLKKGKTYYFRIRVYKTIDGKKVYSKWSAKKKVTIKK